jgi:hypothetical protein
MDTFASNAVKIKVMECGARRMRNNAKWETFSLRVWRAYEMEQTMIRKTIATAGLALALTTGLAYAQQAGLVNVAINDTEILNELQLQAPITVQVPVDVAANVCGVDVNVIAEQTKTNPNYSCEAKSNAQALSQFVTKQQQ